MYGFIDYQCEKTELDIGHHRAAKETNAGTQNVDSISLYIFLVVTLCLHPVKSVGLSYVSLNRMQIDFVLNSVRLTIVAEDCHTGTRASSARYNRRMV